MKRNTVFTTAEMLEPRTLFTISFADPTTYPIAGDALTQPAVSHPGGPELRQRAAQ